MLLYSKIISPRLTFICDFIFREHIGMPYEMTTDESFFNSYEGPKIAYNRTRIANSFLVKNAPLLFEQGIRTRSIDMSRIENMIVLFAENGDSDLEFDLFSACFYLLSRYEEYLPHQKDVHGRYMPENSIAFQQGFLQQPIIEHWIFYFQKKLKTAFPQLVFPEKKFRFIPTFDIDQAFALKNKSLIRTGVSLLRSISKLRMGEFFKKIKIISGLEKDPFDVYDYIGTLTKKFNTGCIFFFLLAKKFSRQADVNIDPEHPQLQKLIRQLSNSYPIGIHPSYASNKEPLLIKKELQKLELILEKEIHLSRQHFLKLEIPLTYYRLITAGIREDYTMGYASQPGFRAGTSFPFYFYDLVREKKTDLLIHPFCIMDVSLKNYMKLSAQESSILINKFIQELKSVNGQMMILWHNESLSEFAGWEGWKQVFEEMLTQAHD